MKCDPNTNHNVEVMFKNFNQIESLNSMFLGFKNIEEIEFINIDTQKVTNM